MKRAWTSVFIALGLCGCVVDIEQEQTQSWVFACDTDEDCSEGFTCQTSTENGQKFCANDAPAQCTTGCCVEGYPDDKACVGMDGVDPQCQTKCVRGVPLECNDLEQNPDSRCLQFAGFIGANSAPVFACVGSCPPGSLEPECRSAGPYPSCSCE